MDTFLSFSDDFCDTDDESLSGAVGCIAASLLDLIAVLLGIASPFVALGMLFFDSPYSLHEVSFFASLAFVGLCVLAIIAYWVARLVEAVHSAVADDPDGSAR